MTPPVRSHWQRQGARALPPTPQPSPGPAGTVRSGRFGGIGRLALSLGVLVGAVGIVAVVAPAPGATLPPAVTAVWPRAGPVAGGTPLTVVGSGFTGATGVTVDGVAATGVTVVSDSLLHAQAPPSGTGSAQMGDVEVTSGAGTSQPNAMDTFAYRAGGTSLAIPSYIYPGAAWAQIDAGHPPVDLAVINPASGPGSAPDPNYAAQVVASHAAGVDVIGYVHTSWGARSLATVEQEIGQYESWYHVDGIFVDEASTDCSLVSPYYAPLYGYIHSQGGLDLTVINPGTATNQCYMSASDVVLGFEGTPSQLTEVGASPYWESAYDPSRFWDVVYSASAGSILSTLSTMAADGAANVYVTDQGLPNPYGALPSYWAQELADIESATPTPTPTPTPQAQVITFTTTPPSPAVVGSQYTAAATGGASGQPVVLSVDPSSGGSCTLVGSTVTFGAVGTCVIDANQAGNASYAAAAQVQQPITVGPAPTTTAPAITSPPGATVSARQPFSITITATGNPTPTIAKSGSLPYGVSFTAGPNGTATIAGTARRSRTYRITITASNGVNPSASQVFTLTVS